MVHGPKVTILMLPVIYKFMKERDGSRLRIAEPSCMRVKRWFAPSGSWTVMYSAREMVHAFGQLDRHVFGERDGSRLRAAGPSCIRRERWFTPSGSWTVVHVKEKDIMKKDEAPESGC